MTLRQRRERAAMPLPAFGALALKLACVLVIGSLVSACGSFSSVGWFNRKEATEDVSNEPPNVIYGKAEALATKGKFKDAARFYEEVDINYPYSPEARRAILMAAYAYYKGGLYDDAISAADRYLTLHPGTQESDLAQNIIAMCYYDRMLDPRRDQSYTRKALEAYDTLLQRYPDSRYAADARNRSRVLRDVLAANEMMVGRFYLRHNNFLAAINRFRTVVADYQTTEQVEEALMRLTEAYMALGIVNEAQTAAAVLGHNFPESKWYRHAYALLGKQGLKPQVNEGSWITRTWKGTAGQT